MRLTKITLQNFRCFKNFTIELDPELTVLVAQNGQGKTAILDAIRVVLWPYLSAFDVVVGTMNKTGIDIDDVRLVQTKGSSFNMEPSLPSVISAEGIIEGNHLSWSRARSKVSKNSGTSIKDAKPLSKYGEKYQQNLRIRSEDDSEDDHSDITLPIVAFYGTGRLWKQARLTTTKQHKSDFFSRTFAYVGALESSSDYKFFVDWFVYTSFAQFERQMAKHGGESFQGLFEDKPYASFIEAVSKSIETAMEPQGWKHLRYSMEKRALVIRHPDLGELKVEQLSDGFRNVIAMVADIAYRCVRLNPHLSLHAPVITEGVVLIDEVDMHLHPAWQQTIISSLQTAFPKIQFIITTHSPQVLTTVDKNNIRLVQKHWDEGAQSWCFDAVVPDFQTKGVASYEALARIMGIDPVPDVEEARWLSDYRKLIEQGKYIQGDAIELREKLKAHFGPEHPELLECDRLIRLMEMKRKIREKGNRDA